MSASQNVGHLVFSHSSVAKVDPLTLKIQALHYIPSIRCNSITQQLCHILEDLHPCQAPDHIKQ